MTSNPYTEKYESTTKVAKNSIPLASIDYCEHAISMCNEAKRGLEAGDRMKWIENLGMMHKDLTELMKLVSVEKLGTLGQHMLYLYFDISLKNSEIMLDASDPSQADIIINKLHETRDFWKDVIEKTKSDTVSDKPTKKDDLL